MSVKGFFLVVALAAILFSGVEYLSYLVESHSRNIILKLGHWPTSRCVNKFFYF